MITKISRIIWFISLVLFLFQPAFSQEEEKKSEAGLVITSIPSGATVFLEGEYNLVATTPATLPHNLIGRYRIKALKDGYENWKTNMWLDGTTANRISITLVPKTRFKGALRSVLIPGWGQFYYGEKKKAFLFSLSALGAAMAYAIADADFSDKNDAYVKVKNDYNAARSIEEVNRLKQLLDEKQREAYDAENIRRATIGLAIAVWGFNLMDALVFFPSFEDGLSVGSSISLEPGEVGLKLSLTKNF
ncbi:MAG: PEGA domain-containing protein [candidate division Zixibacteria bacterium]|nr:PEGA domain-containing protein [candidate division Zixibacteria bacterium]